LRDRTSAGPDPGPVTSETAPFGVSWLSANPLSVLARFGLSTAPGKRVKGRDGKVYERSLQADLVQLQDMHRVALIVCLLNESELRSLGVDFGDYKKRAAALGIGFIHIPVVEMAPFDNPEVVWRACNEVDELLLRNSIDRVVVHCRGGVGRAGTFAACYCMHRALSHSAQLACPELHPTGRHVEYMPADAIAYIRKRRCARALESRKQEDFVSVYAALVACKTRAAAGAGSHPSSSSSATRSTLPLDGSGLAGLLPALDAVDCAE